MFGKEVFNIGCNTVVSGGSRGVMGELTRPGSDISQQVSEGHCVLEGMYCGEGGGVYVGEGNVGMC